MPITGKNSKRYEYLLQLAEKEITSPPTCPAEAMASAHGHRSGGWSRSKIETVRGGLQGVVVSESAHYGTSRFGSLHVTTVDVGARSPCGSCCGTCRKGTRRCFLRNGGCRALPQRR